MVDGDPRVVYPLAAVLSLLYAVAIVYGASFLGYTTFSLVTVVGVAVAFFALTHFAVLR